MPLTYLVTGGAGFIGSAYIKRKLLNKQQDVLVINVDNLSYAGQLDNLAGCESDSRYIFIKADITDAQRMHAIFNDYPVDIVVHFAAETHVDRSIADPLTFTKTNVLGTHCLLEAARNKWLSSFNKPRKGLEKMRFHHVSTDEVYGSLGETGFFNEDSPHAPNSPYSATKTASDNLVRAYYKTYGLNVSITNCSNNYGPGQHDEKLIPTILRQALKEESIPIYGDGRNIRDWLHVDDHCQAIDCVIERSPPGEVYAVGANNEQRNQDIASMICQILDRIRPRAHNKSYCELITLVKDRPGHDYRYAVNASKIYSKLGWQPQHDFVKGLTQTVIWYLKHKNKPVLLES